MFRTRLYHDSPSHLTETQWEILQPLIPPTKLDASFSLHERQTIVDAILSVLHSGCPWRSLPHDVPAWQTVLPLFPHLEARRRLGPRAHRPAHAGLSQARS